MQLFLLLILIAVVLAAFSLMSGRTKRRNAEVEEMARRATQKSAGVEQTELCRTCGTYRAVSDENPCDRDDCPYR